MSWPDKEAFEMRTVRLILKWMAEVLFCGCDGSGRIDSHRWESKMEILGRLHE